MTSHCKNTDKIRQNLCFDNFYFQISAAWENPLFPYSLINKYKNVKNMLYNMFFKHLKIN